MAGAFLLSSTKENFWRSWHICLCQIFPIVIARFLSAVKKTFCFQWFYLVRSVGILEAVHILADN